MPKLIVRLKLPDNCRCSSNEQLDLAGWETDAHGLAILRNYWPRLAGATGQQIRHDSGTYVMRIASAHGIGVRGPWTEMGWPY